LFAGHNVSDAHVGARVAAAPKFIADVNINRRHMTKGQRAMVVAMIYPEPTKVKRSGSSNLEDQTGVARGYVSMARAVLKWGKELADPVLAGAETLDRGYEIIWKS
jgi:hypothetical protein